MSRAHTALRKLVTLAVGLPLLALGIVLIPLPGPGLLISFLALFILSREFEWAGKKFETVKTQVAKIIGEAKARADRTGK